MYIYMYVYIYIYASSLAFRPILSKFYPCIFSKQALLPTCTSWLSRLMFHAWLFF